MIKLNDIKNEVRDFYNKKEALNTEDISLKEYTENKKEELTVETKLNIEKEIKQRLNKFCSFYVERFYKEQYLEDNGLINYTVDCIIKEIAEDEICSINGDLYRFYEKDNHRAFDW